MTDPDSQTARAADHTYESWLDSERHEGDGACVPLVLDLLRHGRSEAHGRGGDSERALTPQGEQWLRALASRLASEGWRPDRAYSSPLKRARDTAAIVLAGAGLALRGEPLPELRAESEPEELLDALTGLGVAGGHVLLVGHQPQVGRLAAHLTGTEPPFSPGDLVRIECPVRLERHSGRIVLALRSVNEGV